MSEYSRGFCDALESVLILAENGKAKNLKELCDKIWVMLKDANRERLKEVIKPLVGI